MTFFFALYLTLGGKLDICRRVDLFFCFALHLTLVGKRTALNCGTFPFKFLGTPLDEGYCWREPGVLFRFVLTKNFEEVLVGCKLYRLSLGTTGRVKSYICTGSCCCMSCSLRL